ncbi:hypothetical protein [Candidatus Odyssella acanthamoebae]|nr:hypothetical protein [Candidatus Paracaedibacter acanthamoebae]
MRKYLLVFVLVLITLLQKLAWSISPTEEEEKKTALEITSGTQLKMV